MVSNLLLAFVAALIPLAASGESLKSLDSKGLDINTPASQDFYQHVNKVWMEAHPLSSEHASYAQYDLLNDSSNNRIFRIVTNLSKENPQRCSNVHSLG